MRALGFALLLVALSASAASAGTKTGVHGLVTKGPITPVCREGVPCDAPAAHVTLVFRRDGKIVARTFTSAKGKYKLRLRAGRYTVAVAKRVGFTLTPRVVVVRQGRFKRVDFSIDTGIR